MRMLIAIVAGSFIAALCQMGATAGDRKKDRPAVVRVLKGWNLEKLGGDEDAMGPKTAPPAVYMSLDEVAKVYTDKEFLAKLDKEVDFSKNVLLRWAWKGGGPPVSYEVKESKEGSVVVFTPVKNRTADLAPGSLELVIPADVYKRAPADEPRAQLAEVTVVAKFRGALRTSVSVIIGGKSFSQRVFTATLEMSDKTLLVAVVAVDKFEGKTDEDKEEAVLDLMFADGDKKLVAIRGRLVPESNDVKTGFRDKQILVLKDKKQLILVGDSITRVDGTNKDRYPPMGKLWVQGDQICAKQDLKLVDERTLAVRNSSLPIILDGDKARVKAGKGPIRVVGSLKIDERGLVRVLADEVKELGK